MDYEKCHNIFEYYRGPTEGGGAKNTEVLGNNVTKALINVLELTDGNGEICKRFIKWLTRETGVKLVPPKVDKFLLQKKNPGDKYLGRETAKRILGIVPHGFTEQIYAENTRPETAASVPDAWLLGKKWTILIESKLHDGLDKNQIKNHKRILRDKQKPVVISWKQLHDFFSKLKDELENEGLLNPRDELLITQFCEFLSQCSLVGFTGFKDSHFDFFDTEVDKDEREETGNDLYEKMYALGEDVWEEWRRKDKNAYPEWDGRDIKRLSKNTGTENFPDCTSIYFCKKLKGHEYEKEEAHQCVQLDKDNLYVWASVKNEALENLRKKIRSRRNELSRILHEMPDEYFVELIIDDGKDYSSCLPWPRLYLSTIKRNPESLLEKIERGIDKYIQDSRPQFNMIRAFEKRNVIRYDGQELVKEIVETMTRLHNFVQFVNNSTK